eukprot:CAMPEP_0180380832 /NCGR_PEP_ID=MMETSP0989-20121125/26279_1 /TAXON_ID=697907 /ORGANISM="non described non described, Strain CCMP2293" /LENGTH=244 /DNA_ID=CAMNT_0022380381 /DNA_START=51 /DNA_END=782 /DNA_ORIENTATION=+
MPPCIVQSEGADAGHVDVAVCLEDGRDGPANTEITEEVVRSSHGHKTLVNLQEPAAARAYLDTIESSLGAGDCEFTWVPASSIPGSFRALLVHEEHLTKVLLDKHGGLDVRVVESKYLENDVYCRQIFLVTPSGALVANAVLRVDLLKLPEAVREGVRAERLPFGKLLMDHVAERCVVLKSLWRARLAPDLLAAYAPPPGAALPPGAEAWGLGEGESYGRTISIKCDGQEAAQVLEVINPYAGC